MLHFNQLGGGLPLVAKLVGSLRPRVLLVLGCWTQRTGCNVKGLRAVALQTVALVFIAGRGTVGWVVGAERLRAVACAPAHLLPRVLRMRARARAGRVGEAVHVDERRVAGLQRRGAARNGSTHCAGGGRRGRRGCTGMFVRNGRDWRHVGTEVVGVVVVIVG
ncbi:hypothetical protein IWX49DRAFT_111287 [Phyllosticta citricarpa]|uniref:Uncharacterized protein n=1 Tax=Phyllosticta paracitricarpa TaxID=2016321 RepID=A0ABR1NIU1_9PEZI